MKCGEIMKSLEEAFPEEYALEWDNIGLLAGSPTWEVHRIYVALDATDEVIAQAIEYEADLLLTHHPLIFSPLRAVTCESLAGRRITAMLQGGLCYYAVHTNYDVVRMGKLAGTRLGLREMSPLEVTAHTLSGEALGIGQIGRLSGEITLEAGAKWVKECFGLKSVKVFGDSGKRIKKAAILPGAGKSGIPFALKQGADVLITGDIDHHAGIDGVAEGLCIIDAGHYGLEHIYVQDMVAFVQEHFPKIEVMGAPVTQPFWVL